MSFPHKFSLLLLILPNFYRNIYIINNIAERNLEYAFYL